MHFATAVFLALSPSFISAWELKAGNTKLGGSRSYSCSPLNHEKGERFRFKPNEGTQGNRQCCLYVYKRERCEGDVRGFCKEKDNDLDWHFRSFEVDCDGRKGGSSGGSQPPIPYDSYDPYLQQYPPPPYGPGPYPQGPPPPGYNQPYQQGPPPPGYPYDPYFNGAPQPYAQNCRQGERCWVNKAVEESSDAENEAKKAE